MASRAVSIVHAGHVEVAPLVIAVAARAGSGFRDDLIGVVSPRGLVACAALGVGLAMRVIRPVPRQQERESSSPVGIRALRRQRSMSCFAVTVPAGMILGQSPRRDLHRG